MESYSRIDTSCLSGLNPLHVVLYPQYLQVFLKEESSYRPDVTRISPSYSRQIFRGKPNLIGKASVFAPAAALQLILRRCDQLAAVSAVFICALFARGGFPLGRVRCVNHAGEG